ncbi:hypothetical protein SALBM135S_04297 [Streptomyces alboniger]
MVPAVEMRAGQTGDFVAMGVHALGLRTHHIDLIGDDHPGELVRALHRDRGIALTDVPSAAGTKRAATRVPHGRRLSLYDTSRSHEDDRLPPAAVAQLAGAAVTRTSPSPSPAPTPCPCCGRRG